jgi:hypothetical protein
MLIVNVLLALIIFSVTRTTANNANIRSPLKKNNYSVHCLTGLQLPTHALHTLPVPATMLWTMLADIEPGYSPRV